MTGNWDCIRREILEDTSFTLEEFRILLYLAAKPPAWTVSLNQLWKTLGIGHNRVDKALRSLRKRGFITSGETQRNDKGQLKRSPSVLVREKVIWTRDHEHHGDGEPTEAEKPQKPRSDRDHEHHGDGHHGHGGQGDLYEEPRGDKPLGEKPEEQEEVDLGISPQEAIRSVDPESTDDHETSPQGSAGTNGRGRDSASVEPSITAGLPSPLEVSPTLAKRARGVDDSDEDFDLRRSPLKNHHSAEVVANGTGCQWDKPCGECDMCLSHRRHRDQRPSFRKMVYRDCVWCNDPKAIEFASQWSAQASEDD